jgi:hypothetical protein
MSAGQSEQRQKEKKRLKDQCYLLVVRTDKQAESGMRQSGPNAATSSGSCLHLDEKQLFFTIRAFVMDCRDPRVRTLTFQCERRITETVPSSRSFE